MTKQEDNASSLSSFIHAGKLLIANIIIADNLNPNRVDIETGSVQEVSDCYCMTRRSHRKKSQNPKA